MFIPDAHDDSIPDASPMQPFSTPAAESIRAYARLFDTPTQAVIATTPEGRIVYWSSGAVELYGWSEEEVLDEEIVEITPTAMTRDTAIAIMEHLRNGRSWSGEFLVRRRDGGEFPAHVQDLPVHNDRGELVGIVGISRPAPR